MIVFEKNDRKPKSCVKSLVEIWVESVVAVVVVDSMLDMATTEEDGKAAILVVADMAKAVLDHLEVDFARAAEEGLHRMVETRVADTVDGIRMDTPTPILVMEVDLQHRPLQPCQRKSLKRRKRRPRRRKRAKRRLQLLLRQVSVLPVLICLVSLWSH
jgi:hypothetical protein